jgi:dipeptidyl aminopeptidase/acylaminoacyl peptidase
MKKQIGSAISVILLAAIVGASQNARHVPTIDELLTLKTVGGAQISPDGKWVAYTVGYGEFKQDAFVTQIWLAEVATGRTFQVTRGDKSSSAPRWSPDGAWLSFLSNRVDDKNQIFTINPLGGESIQLTKSETAIGNFAWSDDGRMIAYLATEPVPQSSKDRKEYMGDFEVVRKEYNFSHIWTLNVSEALTAPVVGKQRTKKKDFSVDSLSWSPDSSRIAFSATVNPDLIQGVTADVYVLNLRDDSIRKVVAQPGPDSGPRWSLDGKQIVFLSAMGETTFFARNLRLAVVAAEGGTPRSLTDKFDEVPGLVDWKPDGIYFAGLRKTTSHLFRVNTVTGVITQVSSPDALMAGSFSLTRDARRLAFTASSPGSLNEVFVTDTRTFAPRALTTMTEQTAGFTLGTRELVSWKSTDGAIIEGVLIKPADFDPAKKYPLLCIIHGGPTGIDRPSLLGPIREDIRPTSGQRVAR